MTFQGISEYLIFFSTLQAEYNAVESDLEEQANWITQVRDKLAVVDDVTGSDDQLIERLDTAKV